MNSLGQNTEVGCRFLLQRIFPGIKRRSPALQADSLLAEPQGKPNEKGGRKQKKNSSLPSTEEMNERMNPEVTYW